MTITSEVAKSLKRRRTISVSQIQREYGLGYRRAQKVLDELIEAKMVKPEKDNAGNHEVVPYDPIYMRVVKGDWRTEEALYVSDPMPMDAAMELEKTIVPTLSPRGSGDSILVKLCEDRGDEYEYMKHGGWLIFTHRETVPW